MSKRGGKPLFELMREDSREGRTRIPITVAPGRFRPASATAPEPPAERTSLISTGPQTQTRTMSFPATTVYVAGTLVIALLLVAWAGGYKLGESSGKRSMLAAVEPGPIEGVVITDPIKDPATNPNLGTTVPPVVIDQGGTPPPAKQPVLGATSDTGEIISSKGFLEADPRIEGTNYLVLATLSEAQASDAVQFLAANGVETIAVPVDSGSRRANNLARYTVVSLAVPVPSGRYSAMRSERDAHQRRLAQLGNRWQRDYRGGSDFSQTLWTKYSP